MAEEGSEGSVANSSSTTNLWEIHGNSLSSLNNVFPWHPPNPNSNSSCEEEISISNSFTNTSNHSGLSDGSSHQLFEPASRQIIEPMSSNEFSGEPVSANQIWHQVLLSSGELHNSQDAGENFLEALSSKNISTDMFEPACDYLKKIDNYWEFPNSESFSNIEKQLSRFNGSFLEHEKLSNLSNLGSNWSIAPPYPDVNSQIISPPPTRNISLNSMDQYSGSDLSQMKQNMPISSEFGTGYGNSGFLPCYGHDLKVDGQHQETEPFETFLHRSLKSNSLRYQMGNNNSVDGDNNSKYCYRMSDLPWSNPRNLSDITSFNDCLKPLVDLQVSKPCLKALNSTDCKKQGRDTSLPVRGNGRGTGVTTEGKRKRCDDTSETLFKKPKRETSTVPSVKVSAPKAKLGERITALQQLVSPFGKTDTASVLQEAIGYIRFLQEQVQLLSNPYMKSNANKDPWGVLERKDKGEAKFDLKSRGLCLVPVSCTPQVCRDNTGSDYWTPTYRGCLYR